MKNFINIKSPATHRQQLDILISRGLIVKDTEFALKVLSRLNYYVLIGYFDEFRENNKGRYFEGLTFEKIYRIYKLDQRLRNLILYAADNVEQALKNIISYNIAHSLDPLAYLNPKNFKNPKELEFLKRDFERAIKKNRNIPYVKHHIEKYNSNFPIWVGIELFTMAMLGKLYQNINEKTRRDIAKQYKKEPVELENFIESIRYLRNICAHNMRIYNHIIPKQPFISDIKFKPTNKIFDSIYVAKFMFHDKDNWENYFCKNLKLLFNEFPEVNLNYAYGFKDDWADLLLL